MLCSITEFHRSEDPGMTHAEEEAMTEAIADELSLLLEEVPPAALFESAINDDRTTTALESLIKWLATNDRLSSASTDLQLAQMVKLVCKLQDAVVAMAASNYNDEAERAYAERLSL